MMEKVGDIWKARLIPLNKKWPNIPDVKEFRPIIVLSAMFKFLEMRFLPKLENYMITRMDRRQSGFLPHLGTQINIT